MKRVVSILLLAIFLFNVGGYYIMFWGLRYQNSQQLSQRLDANLYSPKETVELKIPVTLPYPFSDRAFERIRGDFEHDGDFYKLVKHKFINDTLYIICIKDVEEKKLQQSMNEIASLSNELPGKSDKNTNLLTKLLKDFESKSDLHISGTSGWYLSICFKPKQFNIVNRSSEVLSPPPKV